MTICFAIPTVSSEAKGTVKNVLSGTVQTGALILTILDAAPTRFATPLRFKAW